MSNHTSPQTTVPAAFGLAVYVVCLAITVALVWAFIALMVKGVQSEDLLYTLGSIILIGAGWPFIAATLDITADLIDFLRKK